MPGRTRTCAATKPEIQVVIEMAEERILIVDDEEELATRCQVFLNGKGYRARTASGGEEALLIIGGQQPDLVVADLRMRDMHGLVLLQRIKEDFPDVQVILITASGTVEDAVEALRLHAADFVSKPFTPEQLLAAVERVLAEERRVRPGAEDSVPDNYMELPFKEAKESLVAEFERRYIAEILSKYEGNISRSAIHSGIDRRSLHRLLAKHHIKAKWSKTFH